MPGYAVVCLRFVALIIMFLTVTATASAQTEFDSLKRNSMLDTIYQPSQKPTFVTEHAQLKISGFVQPALYIDNKLKSFMGLKKIMIIRKGVRCVFFS
jgi:hypothetical protein